MYNGHIIEKEIIMTKQEMIDNIVHAQNCLNSVWFEAKQSTNVSLQVECKSADNHLEEVLTLLGYYDY
jgi:hypothetical protein